jgi:hypothetical protein
MTSIERVDYAAEERQLSLIERRSKMLAASNIVPAPLRNKPQDVAAILLTADALNLPLTLATVSQFFVIEGRVQPSAQIMLALAAQRGLEFWWTRTSETVAELAVQRPGSEKVQLFSFTIEEARRANLTNKKVWKDFPTAMLMARATTRAVRATCPDILLGLPDAGFAEPIETAPAGVQMDAAQARTELERPEVVEVVDEPTPETRDDTPEAHTYDRGVPESPAVPSQEAAEEPVQASGGSSLSSDAEPDQNPYAVATHRLARELKLSDADLDEVLFRFFGDASANNVNRGNWQAVAQEMRTASGRAA